MESSVTKVRNRVFHIIRNLTHNEFHVQISYRFIFFKLQLHVIWRQEGGGDSCFLLLIPDRLIAASVMSHSDQWALRVAYKQLLDDVFVISGIIKVEVCIISRSRRLTLITLRPWLFRISQKPSLLIVLLYINLKKNDKRIIAPNTVYFRQAMFLLRCPWTWHCSWKSCIARATYRLFTNLLAD